MTTYEKCFAPLDAPLTWDHVEPGSRLATIHWPSGAFSFHEINDAERICRAFHLAALAEDYAKAKAARDAAPRDDDAVLLAYYDAARMLCEAVRP